MTKAPPPPRLKELSVRLRYEDELLLWSFEKSSSGLRSASLSPSDNKQESVPPKIHKCWIHHIHLTG